MASNWNRALLPAAALLALVPAALAGATPPVPDPAEHEGIVFERQQIMERLDGDAKLVGNIVAGLAPRDQLAAATRAVADGARETLEIYRLEVPGGRTRPEAWTNRADFTRRLEDFARNAEAMAKAGESGNVGAVIELMVDAMPCKACHEVYRAPKQS